MGTPTLCRNFPPFENREGWGSLAVFLLLARSQGLLLCDFVLIDEKEKGAEGIRAFVLPIFRIASSGGKMGHG